MVGGRKDRRALATFAVRRSTGRRSSPPVPSSNEDEDHHEAEPFEEERSLEEVIVIPPPAKKLKSPSEGGIEIEIEIEIDGQRADDSTNSNPQKRATMRSEDVVDNTCSQPASKKAKTSADSDEEMMICSICKKSKNKLDCFSKTQRKSGGNKKCKDCTGHVHVVQKTAEEIKTAAEKSKAAAEKRQIEFEKQMKLKAEEVMHKSKAYAEKEEINYKCIKKGFEDGLKNLQEENIDFEEEMNKRTDYLYMVTSVSAGEDPFSPVLHGIYTTCKKAQDAARRAFEKVSGNYRNGAFVRNDYRLSKCDLSEFLVPARKMTTSRLLYEAFTEPDDDCCEYTAVAVSSLLMVDGTASGCALPFLGSDFSFDLFNPQYVKNSDEDRPEQNGESRKDGSEITKVYAIFDWDMDMSGDHGINMRGVYSNKDDAFAAAQKLAVFGDEEEKKKQIDEAKGKHRGMLYRDEEDNYWGVGMESVVLDAHLDEMVELTDCSGVWLNPSLTWECDA
mmetsp:Transcript_23932/g.35612  ORF Transcript_23932/g.35612 Transcript_23932/m.35612 type:complete len:503 (+) Transcript_23932:52-1560(+)